MIEIIVALIAVFGAVIPYLLQRNEEGKLVNLIFLAIRKDLLGKLLIPDDSPFAQGSRYLIAQVSSDMAKEFDEEVPLCTVTGTFYVPQKAILRANEMIYGGWTMGCNYLGTVNTAFRFG